MMRSKAQQEQPKPRGRVYRRFERAILSLTMRVVAVVVERRLLRAIRETPEPPEQQRGLSWA
jgi:hypothetical protein